MVDDEVYVKVKPFSPSIEMQKKFPRYKLNIHSYVHIQGHTREF